MNAKLPIDSSRLFSPKVTLASSKQPINACSLTEVTPLGIYMPLRLEQSANTRIPIEASRLFSLKTALVRLVQLVNAP